jgi:hypothetical protein
MHVSTSEPDHLLTTRIRYNHNSTHNRPSHALSYPYVTYQTITTTLFLLRYTHLLPQQSLNGIVKQLSAMVSCRCLCFLSGVCSDIWCQMRSPSSARSDTHLHSPDLSVLSDWHCNIIQNSKLQLGQLIHPPVWASKVSAATHGMAI